MIYRKKRMTALLLCVCLVLSLSPLQTALATEETVTSLTLTTPEYVQVKDWDQGAWLLDKNYIHSVIINGQEFPAYCVESAKKSPTDGTAYHEIAAESMQYSQAMMNGLREILRNGYPYTTVICGYDFGNDTVKAQAATQIGVRMWAANCKERENAAYNVFTFWNPEPKNGKLMIRAGRAAGAQEVYGAALALFQLAKSGTQTTISTAMDVRAVDIPAETGRNCTVVSVRVSMTNCDFASLSFNIPEAQIIGIDSEDGTPDGNTLGTYGMSGSLPSGADTPYVRNGEVVHISVPASSDNTKLVIVANGYSTKSVSSLRFYAEDSGTRQRLFVGRTDHYDVTLSEKSINLPTPDPFGDVSISKRSFLDEKSSGSDGSGEGTELKGAHLQILDEYGTVLLDWVTDGKAKELNAVLEAGHTYILHEVSAPQGYTIAPDQTFTVREDGTVSKVIMEDKPTRVEIRKKSALDGSLLSGAVLQIWDGDTKVYEWTTDGQPHTLIGKLTAGRTYRLHEAQAPKGYLIAADVDFTVGMSGETDVVEMVDDYTKVVIQKISLVDGSGLGGATLSLTDSAGKEVERWVSDETPRLMNMKLIPGEVYTLSEVSAPNGYYVADSISFVAGETLNVKLNDPPTVVRTSKKDENTREFISGARMQILDKDGNLYDEWVTNGTPHETIAKLAAGEEYVLHEAEAPIGYSLGDDLVFTVPTTEERKELEYYNTRAMLALSLPKTGDTIGTYVLYGIFSFLAAVALGTGAILQQNRKKNNKIAKQ